MAYLVGETIFEHTGLKIAHLYFSCEILFIFWWRLRVRDIQRIEEPQYIPSELLPKLYDEFLNLLKVAPDLISNYFFNVENKYIYKENLENFIGYYFFNDQYRFLNASNKKSVDGFITRAEKILNHTFIKGYNPNAKFMNISYDPVYPLWRPLLYYVSLKFLDYIKGIILYMYNFKFDQVGNVRYYYRKLNDTPGCTNYNKPILFIHGLGVGLYAYLYMITRICSDKDMYLLDLNWVSGTICDTIPFPNEYCKSLELLFFKHQLYECKLNVVCHSYGSCVFSWINRRYKSIINSCILLEPVAFLLLDASTIYNFCYKDYYINNFSSAVIRNLCSKDMNISHLFFRKFFWWDNIVLFNELPEKTYIMVSKNDQIMNAARVRDFWYTMKKEENVKLEFNTKLLSHAHVLFDKNKINDIKQIIEDFSKND